MIFAGCATIMCGTKQRIEVSSSPSGAQVSIKMLNGLTLFTGTTPTTCRLPRRRDYLVTIQMEGYRDAEFYVSREFNGWVIGNVIFVRAFFIGGLVDLLDGAIWKLEPDDIHVELTKSYASGRLETQAVLKALDREGKMRTLNIPMIPTH